MPFCDNCGTKYEEGAKFCMNCGKNFEGVHLVQHAATPVAQPVAAGVPQAVPVATPVAPVAAVPGGVTTADEIRAQAERQDRLAMIAMTQANAGAVNNNNNNNNIVVNVQGGGQQIMYYQDPGCCMKCCCPPCAVYATYGDCRCPQMLFACVFGYFYTLCCWSPATERRMGAPEGEEICGAPEGEDGLEM